MKNSNEQTPLRIPDDMGALYQELSESLHRLETNPDFKKVFLDFYLNQFAAGRVELLNTPNKNMRADVFELLISVANFKDFIMFIHNMADSYKHDLLNDNAE